MRDHFNEEKIQTSTQTHEETLLQELTCDADSRVKEDALNMYAEFFPIFGYSEDQGQFGIELSFRN